MRLTWVAAAFAAAMSTAVPAHAGGEWPDGPNKHGSRNYRGPIIISRPTATSTPSRCSVAASPTPSKPNSRSSPATEASRRSLVCLAQRRMGFGAAGKDRARLCARRSSPICSCSPARSNASCGQRADCDGQGRGHQRSRPHSGEEQGPHCPRCIINKLGPNPIFFGVGNEGHICRACWEEDRAKDRRK